MTSTQHRGRRGPRRPGRPGRPRHRGAARQRRSRLAPRPASRPASRGRTSRSPRASPTASPCACSTTRRGNPDPGAGQRRRCLARVRAGRRAGAGLRVPRRRAVGPGARPAVQPGQAAARPVRQGDQRNGHRSGPRCSARTRPTRPSRAPWTPPGTCHGAWSWTPGSAGRTAAAPVPLLRHGPLRDPRQGLHHAPPGHPARSCAGPTPGWPTRPPSRT